MAGGPTIGAARPMLRSKAAIDAIRDAARELGAAMYRATGYPPAALLVAVRDELFVRVAVMHAERTGAALAEIERLGVVDLEVDGVEVRIVSEHAANAAADLARTICGH